MNNTRLHIIWNNMKQRCNNPNRKDYKYYGAKGITVCEDWNEYKNFEKWAINNGYSDNLTIERKITSIGYFPNNCEWVLFSQQRNNTTQTRLITIGNETKPLKHWCEYFGISYHMVAQRIHRGMEQEKAFTNPPQRRNKNGK